jgi:serine/threonine-protein kinase
MDPDAFQRWSHLDEIFSRVLETAQEERERCIQTACDGDADLEEEIRRLLAALEDSGDFLSDPSAWLPDLELSPEDPPPEPAGVVVGNYRLLEVLGRGGMGTVYLAERSDGEFQQRVALKLLRNRIASREETRRFQQERQILATLHHPHIARLLDGGVVEDGRLYCVMEFVDGLPIDRYCDSHRLGVDERLRLFQKICAAVHHAHQNLVVHRDLKPGNILVTTEGVPVLLDFGIAKLLETDGTGTASEETRTGRRLMTPSYASPEQVLGRTITTASDVYQLGILLYELLTGRRPFRGSGGILDLERIIPTQDPARPSAAVTRDPDKDEEREGGGPRPEEVGQARSTSVDRLRRRLRGDLDNIVLMCVRKEPERRYRSARELEEDLERHLSGYPVQARPDTVSYRSAKFIRRHRFGVGVAAMAVLGLFGFGGTLARQNARVTRERDRAEAVTGFLLDLFGQANPDREGEELTLRQFLADGAQQAREQMAGQPAVEVAVLNLIGAAYRELGRLDEARSILEEALEVGTRALGPEDLEVATTRDELGVVILYQMRDRSAAEELLREALAVRERKLGKLNVNTLGALNDLALALHSQGRLDEAEALYREALNRQRNLDPEVISTLRSMTLTNVGWLLQARGALQESDSVLQEALEVRRSTYSTPHPRLANSLSALAGSRIRLGDYASADSLTRLALAIRREVLGDVHPRIADDLKSLGDIQAARGEWSEAEASYLEAHSIYGKTAGPRSQGAAWVLTGLSELFNTCGDYQKGEAYGREGFEIYRELLGVQHPFTAMALGEMARGIHGRGEYDRAETLYRDALATLQEAYGESNSSVAGAQVRLGELLLDRGDPAGAEPLLRQALATQETGLRGHGWRASYIRALLARALVGQGAVDEGLSLMGEASAGMDAALGSPDIRAARVAGWLREMEAAFGSPGGGQGQVPLPR